MKHFWTTLFVLLGTALAGCQARSFNQGSATVTSVSGAVVLQKSQWKPRDYFPANENDDSAAAEMARVELWNMFERKTSRWVCAQAERFWACAIPHSRGDAWVLWIHLPAELAFAAGTEVHLTLNGASGNFTLLEHDGSKNLLLTNGVEGCVTRQDNEAFRSVCRPAEPEAAALFAHALGNSGTSRKRPDWSLKIEIDGLESQSLILPGEAQTKVGAARASKSRALRR